ncbi:MAG: protein-export chaperone SecB [Bacteroidales bacterium]|nr:protein-export chaperone SecB [Bacteroidales bacterium]
MNLNNPKPSPFRFIGFNVIESIIKYTPIVDSEMNMEFGISPSGVIDKNKKKYQITLLVEIKDKSEQFFSKVVINGIFEFKEVTSIEHLDNYFFINAPAIIFPYIRSYIAALTSLSGFGTINLPPINVGMLKEDLKANTIDGELGI